MAECYIKCDKSIVINSDLFEDIERINTKYSPGEPPKVPFFTLLMRETCPRSLKASEVDMTSKRTEKCLYTSHSDNESWQSAYLEQDPICSCQPTCTTAVSLKDRPKSPVVIHKMCLTRKELEHEIAKNKLIQLFRGRFNYEELLDYFCADKKSEPKEKGGNGEQKKEEEKADDGEKEEEDGGGDDDKGDDKKDDEEDKKHPPKKKRTKAAPANIDSEPPVDQEHSILKNPMKEPEVPRVVRPYEVPLDNKNGGVDFFPGKPRLAQRYKAEDINQARKRKPIVEEADDRFRLKSKASCSNPSATSLF